ncbi:MAG: agmatinase [Chloroflexi bacterium]|nr:agmatinase [Chloroflexota bacterium]
MSDTHSLWADLHRPNSTPAETTFTVIGIPYDRSASARQGAALGPQRIRRWTHHLTPFTEDRTRLGQLSVCDLGDIAIEDQPRDFERARQVIAALPNIPIILGGDHSISIPVLRAQRERFAGKRLGLLWVDAHPDLCDEFDGSRLSHACVLRRGLESGIEQRDVCLVGLRSWEEPEIDLIEKGQMNVCPMPMVAERGMAAIAAEVKRILSACDAVHISLDIDCLDPAAAPGTGIPEAGGMTAREALTLIKAMQGLPLVGLDVVEVAPPLDPSESTVFAALKIIMEFMGVIARGAK